jgi:ribosome maturation factor RimP
MGGCQSSPFFLFVQRLFFLNAPASSPASWPASWQSAVARTVAALGYDTVDVERSAGGLLRVTIDRLPGHAYPTGESPSVTIDDCEAVTHQLQYALEVDHVDYARLEVSSPGLDRPLRKEADYARFVGEAAEITLKAPFEGRRKFRGLLAARDGGWRLVLDDRVGMPADPRERGRRKTTGQAGAQDAAATVATLDFELHEVREARLVPVLNFKGRATNEGRTEAAAGGVE